ncbi:hypothetical protein KKG31_03425 [Patescibacteria group bacterium]|nr:hypothetical protein [Patescibacteria group bacterium]MBU1758198.1 hypothetical protein [Patescibacteria group bacterium]
MYVKGALTIPTNIDNSVQVIRKIILSTDGVSTTGENVVVTIDSDTGAVSQIKVRGNMDVGDKTNSIVGTWSSIA